jgi:hypothetical protein
MLGPAWDKFSVPKKSPKTVKVVHRQVIQQHSESKTKNRKFFPLSRVTHRSFHRLPLVDKLWEHFRNAVVPMPYNNIPFLRFFL